MSINNIVPGTFRIKGTIIISSSSVTPPWGQSRLFFYYTNLAINYILKLLFLNFIVYYTRTYLQGSKYAQKEKK